MDNIIQSSNPMQDDVHTGSRKEEDLNTTENGREKQQTAEEIIADLNLTEEDFPHLNSWTNKGHLLRTLEGIAKSSGCSLRTTAVNLELDLSMT